MKKAKLIKLVKKLAKTNPYPHNETGLDDWILDGGDTYDMTPEEIAQEWDEVNSQ